MRPITTLVSLALTVVLGLAAAARPVAAADVTPHKLTGQYVEFCSCERFCDSAVSDGRRAGCNMVLGLRIEAGQRGEISLGGVTAAIVAPAAGAAAPPDAKSPPAPVLYVDRGATPAQVEALRTIVNERFAARLGGPLAGARPTSIQVTRTSEGLAVTIEGVADLRARPFMGGFGRTVQLENAPGATIPFPMMGRGTGGQVTDGNAGVRFDGANRNVFFGKFDFGGTKARRRS